MTATHDQAQTATADLQPPVIPESAPAAPVRPPLSAALLCRLLALAVVLGGLYAVGALLPYWFLHSPAPGTVFFPSAGLTLATLMLSPRRYWPLWLVAFGIAEFSVDITHHETVWMALGFALANTVEPYVGARLVRRHHARTRPRTLRDRSLPYVVLAVAVAPVVGSMIGASVAWLADGTYSWGSIMWHWWLGDALGVLVVATPILAWARPSPYDKRPSIFSVALFTVLATVVTIVPTIIWERPMLYVVLAIIMCAALYGGTPASATTGFGVAFAVDWAVVTGRAQDLVPNTSQSQVLVYVQFFLGISLLAALVLSVSIADRVRAERRVARAEGERNRAERQVVTAAEDERRRIARETHDIVGHALNAMLLQAGAARRMLDRDSNRTRALLESMETEGRDAFRDLDLALGLGDRTHDLDPVRGLANLPELVDRMQRAGISVSLEVIGEPVNISTLVDWSAYRIAQEALTNVAKHAMGARASVEVAHSPEFVTLTVVDDGGFTAKSTTRGGHGLVGMRERVAVLGGEITLGPQPRGGFLVRARLPIRGSKS